MLSFKSILIIPAFLYICMILLYVFILIVLRKDFIAYNIIQHGLSLPDLNWYFS
jgi:hypothetical protein